MPERRKGTTMALKRPSEGDKMPGLHFCFDSGGGLRLREPLLLQSVKSLVHEEWFRQKTLLSTENMFLGFTYHPAYPVTLLENDDFFICLEGRIYGETPSGIDSRISELASYLAGGGEPDIEKTVRWLYATDGDFVIFINQRATGKTFILSDLLGRLPLYYEIRNGRIVVSRETRFITGLAGDTRFDRIAIAQYLLLGFMPGERTFLENVKRAGAAVLISIDPGRPAINVRNVHRFDFSRRKHEGIGAAEAAERMVPLFVRACSDRVSTGGPNVLALSGGLDSRSVAAGLKEAGPSFTGATFLDHFETAAPDVNVAMKIAHTLGFEWRLFPLGPASGKDVLRLLRTKNGMNFLGMSFSMSLFDGIREEWGDKITYFTGEGGGLTIPDNRPFRRMKDLDDLTRHLISRNRIIPLEQAAAITRMEAGDIFESIKGYLAACPEESHEEKYLHFIICERYMKWTAEGEDRNRFFFWTTSPFSSTAFFDFVVNCPDSLKSKYRLYREFLLRLSPEAAGIINVNWNQPISGRKYLLYLYLRELYYRMPEPLRKIVRNRTKQAADVVGPYGIDSNLVKCLLSQFDVCGAVPEHLSRQAIETGMVSTGKYALDHIFTVSSVIEDFAAGRSTLEDFSGSDLI